MDSALLQCVHTIHNEYRSSSVTIVGHRKQGEDQGEEGTESARAVFHCLAKLVI